MVGLLALWVVGWVLGPWVVLLMGAVGACLGLAGWGWVVSQSVFRWGVCLLGAGTLAYVYACAAAPCPFTWQSIPVRRS